ncbi:efflux RND transporter permease subunit [Shigella flexneri]
MAFATVSQRFGPLAINHLAQVPFIRHFSLISRRVALHWKRGGEHGWISLEQRIPVYEDITTRFGARPSPLKMPSPAHCWLNPRRRGGDVRVLGILYESFIQPITVLFRPATAGVGALLALIVAGNELDVIAIIRYYSANRDSEENAIMMIDFALAAGTRTGTVTV